MHTYISFLTSNLSILQTIRKILSHTSAKRFTKTFLLRNHIFLFFFFFFSRIRVSCQVTLTSQLDGKKRIFFYDVLQSMERFVHTRAHAICYYLFLFLFFFAKETFSTKKNHLKRILFIDHRYLSIVCHRSSYIQCIHVFNSHIILKFIRKFYLKHTSLSLFLSFSLFLLDQNRYR